MDTPEEPTAEPDPAVPTVPVRSDGWPNLVGRRPMSNAAGTRSAEPSPKASLTNRSPTPGRSGATSPSTRASSSGYAADPRRRPYHATDTTITIGIRGPDAQERINQLRQALNNLWTRHGWTTRDEPR